MLVANNLSHGSDTASLHKSMFKNYSRWCHHLGVEAEPSQTYENQAQKKRPRANQPALERHEQEQQEREREECEQQERIDMVLFLLIWSEASIFRACPEYLCFLYYKMRYQFKEDPNDQWAHDEFLDQVIAPVYILMAKEMTKSDTRGGL